MCQLSVLWLAVSPRDDSSNSQHDMLHFMWIIEIYRMHPVQIESSLQATDNVCLSSCIQFFQSILAHYFLYWWQWPKTASQHLPQTREALYPLQHWHKALTSTPTPTLLSPIITFDLFRFRHENCDNIHLVWGPLSKYSFGVDSSSIGQLGNVSLIRLLFSVPIDRMVFWVLLGENDILSPGLRNYTGPRSSGQSLNWIVCSKIKLLRRCRVCEPTEMTIEVKDKFSRARSHGQDWPLRNDEWTEQTTDCPQSHPVTRRVVPKGPHRRFVTLTFKDFWCCLVRHWKRCSKEGKESERKSHIRHNQLKAWVYKFQVSES